MSRRGRPGRSSPGPLHTPGGNRRRPARPPAAGLRALLAWLRSPERSLRPLLLGILALGLLVRLIHFATLAATPYPRFPLVLTQADPHATWQWAGAILGGDLLGRETYHPYFDWMRGIAPLETWHRWWGGREIFQQAPLYAYWVAGLLAVLRQSLSAVLLVQLLVGALTPLVVFGLGQRVFGNRQVSLLAAALTALYGPLVFIQGTLLRDWLPPLIEPLVILVALQAAASDRDRGWVGVGALGGLAVLAKESAPLLFPPVLLSLVVARRQAPVRLVRGVLLLGLGALLGLAPLLLRNVAVGAPPLAISNRFAETFIQANAADGLATGLAIPPSLGDILERSGGKPIGVVRETLHSHRDGWRGLAARQLTKLRALVDPFEIPNNLDFYYAREISPILRALPGYSVLFPLAAAGLLVTIPGSRWAHGVLGLYTLGAVGGLLVGPVLSRYRLVLIPAMTLYAAAGAVRAWDAVQRRETRWWVTYAVLVAAATLTQQLVAPIRALRSIPEAVVHPLEYGAAAQLYVQAGQFDRALDEIHRLRSRAAGHPGFRAVQITAAGEEIELRTQWASHLISQRRFREARSQLDAAAPLADAHEGANHRLANLGFLYAQLGERDRAVHYLRRFLQRDPDGAMAASVRQLLLRLGDAP